MEFTINKAARRQFADLAENLMAAYISYTGGISYLAAKKNYGRATGHPIGDYWVLLAMRTTNEVIEVREWEVERHLEKQKERPSRRKVAARP